MIELIRLAAGAGRRRQRFAGLHTPGGFERDLGRRVVELNSAAQAAATGGDS